MTAKQEAFCRAFVTNGHKGPAAYRASRDASRMAPHTIAVNAGHLLRHPKVIARIAELEAEATKIASAELAITLEGQTLKLQEVYEKALAAKHWTAAITAVEAQNKIHGLITKDRENEKGSTLKERLEQIRAERKARRQAQAAEEAENVVQLPARRA